MSKLDQDRQKRGVLYQEELPGVTVDWLWSGFSRNYNRRAIPPNYFYTAENVRLENGDVSSRRGIAVVNTSDNTSNTCLLGMSNQSSLNVNGRLIMCLGDYAYLYQPSFSKGTVYDLNPDSSGGTPLDTGFVTKHNGALWMASGRKLALKIENNGTISGAASSTQMSPTPDYNIASFPTPVNALENSSTDLEIDRAGLNDLWWASSNGNIYRFNDVATIVDATGFTNPAFVGSLNEQLFMACTPIIEGDNTTFFVRGFDGTWTGITPGAFSLSSNTDDEFVPVGWTYYKGNALIHGYFTEASGTGTYFGGVLIWNGTTLTEGHITSTRVGSSESSPLGIVDATVFSGNYYFTWTADSPQASSIGRYNNSTFNDTLIDTTAITSTANHFPTAIGAVGDFLVFAADVGGADGQEFYRSSNLSSWTELTVSSGETNSDGNTADTFSNTSLV